MSIKISVGVAEGELDWELLEECRSASRTSAPEVELEAGAGWPCPAERGDDELDADQPAWAW
jgi:hypothetical protein